MPLNKVCVAVITKPLGVNGQVKIRTYTESPESFIGYGRFFLFDGTLLNLERPKIKGENEIVSWISGYNSRTEIEKFRSKSLYIRREDLPKLPEGEFYLEDLSDLNVFDQHDNKIGEVGAAFDYGAGTFLDIKLFETKRITTLPFNGKSVIHIDLNSKFIKINDSFIVK
ncbi:MAG: ribosome maturation factor RimM [Holosporales bacterium]|jgi:16S rRNA processing protein RimM|nr:ribosome maturation factor RimM [Holosporales bacterium]